MCDLNLKEYPFDEPNCSIVLESWLYNVSELEINVKPTGFDLVVRLVLYINEPLISMFNKIPV